MERLKHEPDALRAQPGPAVLAQHGQVLAVQPQMPRGRQVQPGQHGQQGGLAGSGCTGDRDRLTPCDVEGDIVHNGERPFRAANLFSEVYDLENAIGIGALRGTRTDIAAHRAPGRGGRAKSHHPQLR